MTPSINSFATSPGIKFGRTETHRGTTDAASKPAPGRDSECRAPKIERGTDSAEFSRESLWFALSNAENAEGGKSAFRAGLVESVRRMIDSGEYDTPERLDAAADSLIEGL